MPSQSFAEMRRRNALKILETIRHTPDASRADVARATTLARATVSSIVDDLIELGILKETGLKESAKGRRATGLTFNAEGCFSVGLSIDRQRLDLVICDIEGNVRFEDTIKTDAGNPDELVLATVQFLEHAVVLESIPSDKLGPVGLAVPGPLPVASIERFFHKPAADVDFRIVREKLEQSLNRPVTLDTNLNMYAIACTRSHSSDCLLIIRAGHLVRSALVFENRLFEGHNKLAGELGHLKVPGRMRQCFCGAAGCINALASAPAIISRCLEIDNSLNDLESISQAIADGNDGCIEILKDAGTALGHGVAAAINLLAPDIVLIVGRNVVSHEFVQHEIMSTVAHCAIAPNFENCAIEICTADERMEARGAALKAIAHHDLLPPDRL
jgi:predicted NBD/HSP70 family sugar kinase